MIHKGFIFILLFGSMQALGSSLEMIQEKLGRISISSYPGPDGSTGAGKDASGKSPPSPQRVEVFPFNEQVQLQVRLTPDTGVKGVRLSFFNVCMPHHNHCMKLQPRIEPVAGQENQWIVSGVKLHMDGPWLVTLRFTGDGGTETEVNKNIFVSMPGSSGTTTPSKDNTEHK